jgi:hypothetical protein
LFGATWPEQDLKSPGGCKFDRNNVRVTANAPRLALKLKRIILFNKATFSIYPKTGALKNQIKIGAKKKSALPDNIELK